MEQVEWNELFMEAVRMEKQIPPHSTSLRYGMTNEKESRFPSGMTTRNRKCRGNSMGVCESRAVTGERSMVAKTDEGRVGRRLEGRLGGE